MSAIQRFTLLSHVVFRGRNPTIQAQMSEHTQRRILSTMSDYKLRSWNFSRLYAVTYMRIHSPGCSFVDPKFDEYNRLSFVLERRVQADPCQARLLDLPENTSQLKLVLFSPLQSWLVSTILGCRSDSATEQKRGGMRVGVWVKGEGCRQSRGPRLFGSPPCGRKTMCDEW